MLKKISVISVFAVELLFMRQWFLCKRFKDYIHFLSTNQSLYLEDLTHGNKGESIILIRLFHNKIIVFITIFSKYYLRFWDERFALNLFSIVGYFGIILGIYYLINRNFKNKKYLWIAFIFLLILPLFEIIFEPVINFTYKIIFLTLPFQAFSLFGIWQFLKEDKNNLRLIIIFCLIFVSMWWISVLQPDAYNYCVK